MSTAPVDVLIVDDDEEWSTLVARSLRARGLEVATTATSLGASNLVRRLQPDVVLVDVDIPALSGDALVSLLRRSAPTKTRILLHSAHDEATLRSLASRSQADGYLSKSLDLEELVKQVRAATARSARTAR